MLLHIRKQLFIAKSAEIGEDIFVQGSVCTAVKGTAVGVGIYGKSVYSLALTVDVIAEQYFALRLTQSAESKIYVAEFNGVVFKLVFKLFYTGYMFCNTVICPEM